MFVWCVFVFVFVFVCVCVCAVLQCPRSKTFSKSVQKVIKKCYTRVCVPVQRCGVLARSGRVHRVPEARSELVPPGGAGLRRLPDGGTCVRG